MIQDLDGNTLDETLAFLGELLEVEGADPIHLLVVGGAALLNAEIVTRTTRDIDVFARREIPEGAIVPIRTLPAEVAEAAEKVGAELGLEPNWLNATAGLFSVPLESCPGDVWADMDTREYGSCLQVSFLGRQGLIYFKLYAAIDPERARRKPDRDDLVKLAPTREETRKAVRWLQGEELVALSDQGELNQVLKSIGHADLLS